MSTLDRLFALRVPGLVLALAFSAVAPRAQAILEVPLSASVNETTRAPAIP